MKGTGQFLYKGNTYHAGEGDLLFIPPGTKYYSVWSGSPEIKFYSIDFDFASRQRIKNYQFQIVGGFSDDLFDQMYCSYHSDQLYSISCFCKLLSEIYNALPPASENDYHKIDAAVSYIESHYRENFSIEFLAKLCNMSVSGFFAQFKKATGVSPINFKHNIVIQKALNMISGTQMPIDEISRRLGFSSPNYFRKVFAKETGFYPSYFRKKDSPQH